MARTVSLAMVQAKLNIEQERLAAYTKQIESIELQLKEVKERKAKKEVVVNELTATVNRLTTPN